MKKTAIVLLALLLALVAGCAGSSEVTKEPAASVLPPIIDRELLFGDPEISGSQLSPDGKYLSFLKQHKDVRNVWVKAVDEPFDKAKPVTASERPVFIYFWSQDSNYILFLQDKGGNENWLVYAVDPTAAPEEATGVPTTRNLTPVEETRAFLYAVPKNKPGEIIVGLNDRDKSYADVYRVDIATGKRELLIKNTEKVGSWIYDDDGNVRLAIRQKDDGGTEILRVDGEKLVRIYDCSVEENCFPYHLHKDGKRAYFVSNKGPEADLTSLMFLDLATGKTELIESDPEKQVDFGGLLFTEDTDELMLTAYVGDRKRIYPKMKEVEQDLQFLKENLPDGELSIGSMTRDMKHFLVYVGRDVDPGSAYLYDRANKKTSLVYRSRPKLQAEHLAEMKPVRYKARDGLEIPAYLTLPRGIPPKNLPVIIHPHGGPWARDHWGYNPYAQFLANRGYAVLQPNFRSSTGYGKKYLNSGNRTWGTGAMQHDITDGVKWLVDQGIADPKKVCIFGGSYGGYATLAGVAFTPDLYKCGIPYVAVSNILTTTESFPAYWKPFLKTWYARVGDPEVEADRKDMLERSPVNHVDKIKVPLLVVHGANDPRVKQFESDSIVVAVREKGEPVEYVVAPDEGHGFRSPENRMALAVSMEKFLAKHLGGRVQQEVPEKIAKQLASITVDPTSVELPDKAQLEALAKAKTAPLPASNGKAIKAGSMNYKVTMSMGERKMDLAVTRLLELVGKGKDKRVRITSTTKTPQGEQVDVFDLDGATLQPLERNVTGTATVKLTYTPAEIKGEMGAGGRTMPLNQKLEAPVLGDGAGLELAIAGLPLADGYSTTYRTFEPMSQKVRAMKLEVTGKEKTKAAAGEFDTWVLKLVPLDDEKGGGGTLHVLAEAPHHVVRGEYLLPAMMGGGTVSTELTATGPAKKAKKSKKSKKRRKSKKGK